MFDDALFRSRLAKLKTSLELEEKYWKETGRDAEELTELGRRNVSQELVREFETIIASADKQYEVAQKSFYEQEISDHKT